MTQRVLCVGLGGLGSPALQVLLRSGLRAFTLVDDDRVDESNLQRQTLYTDQDLGQLKVEAAAARLCSWAAELGGPAPDLRLVAARALPNTIEQLVTGHGLVLEGGDNFATKFMTADACRLAGVATVQAGAIGWNGWVLASTPESACLRCVFEDIPRGEPETCATAGVVGPVVGVIGALQAAQALCLLQGRHSAAGQLIHYQALSGQLRRINVTRRDDCPLCTGKIDRMDLARYLPPECAA